MFKKKNIIIAVVAVVILAVLFIGFKLLVKVGNPKYFYNYLHDAAGSREVESFKSNAAGADLVKAAPTENTDPDKRGVVQRIEVDGTPVDSFSRADRSFTIVYRLSVDIIFLCIDYNIFCISVTTDPTHQVTMLLFMQLIQ